MTWNLKHRFSATMETRHSQSSESWNISGLKIFNDKHSLLSLFDTLSKNADLTNTQNETSQNGSEWQFNFMGQVDIPNGRC